MRGGGALGRRCKIYDFYLVVCLFRVYVSGIPFVNGSIITETIGDY